MNMSEKTGCAPSEIDVSGLCIPKSYKDSNTLRVINLSNKLLEIYKQKFSTESEAAAFVKNNSEITTEYLIKKEKDIYRKVIRNNWKSSDIVFKK